MSRTGEVKATTPSAGLKYYALAVVASAAATALKVALASYIVPTYILAYPAVMLAATLGGLGPGLLATALTAVMAWYWLIPPEGFGPLSLPDAASLLLFVGMGVFMSIVANVYLQAAHRVEMLERERALWASDERYRKLFETMPVGVTYQDATGAILSANHAAERLLGLSIDQILGRTSLDPRWKTIHPDGSDFPGSEHPAMVVLRSGKEIRGEVMGVFNPVLGAHTWISVSAVPLFDPLRKVVIGALTTFEDVTEQKLANEAVATSEGRLREAQRIAHVGNWELDIQADVLTWSDEIYRIFEIDPESSGALHEAFYATIHSDDRESVKKAYTRSLETRSPYRITHRLRMPDGRIKYVQESCGTHFSPEGKPLRSIGNVLDVTEQWALQEQLAVAARLAAMGTLVAGVAHEINNPLAAELANQGLALEVVQEVRERLLGNAPLDREAAGRSLDEVLEALKDAETGGRRVARIVKDLTTFGRPDPRRTRVRLMDVVDESMRWLHATVVQTSTVRVDNLSAPDVIASAGQIEQVLVNLVTNAAKATPEGQRREIVVRLGPGTPGMARLEVIDQGVGMDPALMDRIFDPFFTTRQVGQGTGLGLSISHSIVTAHGGTLTVESEVGKGSTFRMELPAAPVEA